MIKRRNDRLVSMYLPCNNAVDLKTERHRAKIPTLGRARFKEFGYVPTKESALSVTITKLEGRYFALFVFEVECSQTENGQQSAEIGIDLGAKSFAVLSDINKTH